MIGKKKTEVQIAEEIIDLAKSISDNGIEVIISGLITRGDRYSRVPNNRGGGVIIIGGGGGLEMVRYINYRGVGIIGGGGAWRKENSPFLR